MKRMIVVLAVASSLLAADITGRWVLNAGAAGKLYFTFGVSGTKLTGKVPCGNCADLNVDNGVIAGDKFTFSTTLTLPNRDGKPVDYGTQCSGLVKDNDTIELTCDAGRGRGPHTDVLKRDPAAPAAK